MIDRYGNTLEGIAKFKDIVDKGGKIFCHPKLYFVILDAARGWDLSIDMKVVLRPGVPGLPMTSVTAVSKDARDAQAIRFKD